MLAVECVVCVLFAVWGFGLWWLIRSRRLVLGHWAGIRTRATMRSEKAWRWAHEQTRPGLLATGALALITLGMVLVLNGPAAMPPTALAVGVAGLICVVGVAVLAVSVAHRSAGDISG